MSYNLIQIDFETAGARGTPDLDSENLTAEKAKRK